MRSLNRFRGLLRIQIATESFVTAVAPEKVVVRGGGVGLGGGGTGQKHNPHFTSRIKTYKFHVFSSLLFTALF